MKKPMLIVAVCAALQFVAAHAAQGIIEPQDRSAAKPRPQASASTEASPKAGRGLEDRGNKQYLPTVRAKPGSGSGDVRRIIDPEDRSAAPTTASGKRVPQKVRETPRPSRDTNLERDPGKSERRRLAQPQSDPRAAAFDAFVPPKPQPERRDQ